MEDRNEGGGGGGENEWEKGVRQRGTRVCA